MKARKGTSCRETDDEQKKMGGGAEKLWRGTAQNTLCIRMEMKPTVYNYCVLTETSKQ